MDELIKLIKEEVLWFIHFVNYLSLVVNAKLEIWWDAVESKGFWLSKTSMGYI